MCDKCYNKKLEFNFNTLCIFNITINYIYILKIVMIKTKSFRWFDNYDCDDIHELNP